jgi:magnesium transporter
MERSSSSHGSAGHLVIDVQPGEQQGDLILSQPGSRSDAAIWQVNSKASISGTSLGQSVDVADDEQSDTILASVANRLPWLVGLMLVQSVSGYVVAKYESLIQQHVIIASFLTMLVGGGGNSSGQTVAELVRALRKGEISSECFWRVLFRETAIGLLLSVGLGLAAFPRVRFLHKGSTNMDALAISISYTIIIVIANALAVCVTMFLHLFGRAAVGAPPVVQVLVDVLGITISCVVCSAILE